MGHPQPPTIINTDNSTTTGFVNNNIQMKRSKSWDMRLHWLRDKEVLKHLKIEWAKGKDNKTDYFTKNHAITHHRKMRPEYIRDQINIIFKKVQHLKRIELWNTIRHESARVC